MLRKSSSCFIVYWIMYNETEGRNYTKSVAENVDHHSKNLLTLDRLVAVKWPFFYEVKIQAKHIYFAVGFNWGFTIVFGVILLIIYVTIDTSRVLSATNIMFIVTFLCGFITLLLSNTFIFTEARNKLHAIEKLTVADREKLKENRRMFRKKELRIVELNIGLIICFFLFWINALIVDIYSLALSGPMGFTYMLSGWYLVHIYYICNPMWYVSMNQDVKRELKIFFLKKISRSPQTVVHCQSFKSYIFKCGERKHET